MRFFLFGKILPQFVSRRPPLVERVKELPVNGFGNRLLHSKVFPATARSTSVVRQRFFQPVGDFTRLENDWLEVDACSGLFGFAEGRRVRLNPASGQGLDLVTKASVDVDFGVCFYRRRNMQ